MLVAVVVVALAVPALALSGRLDSLFSFSTEGTEVDPHTLALGTASALADVEATNTVRLLTIRDGVAFYLARTPEGRLCPFTGPANQPRPSFSEFGCLEPESLG